MDLGLKGRVALVAGSSAGIGEAVAHALAAEGADLLLCARRKQALEEVASSIRELAGIRVEIAPADLSTAEGCETVLARLQATFGGADILVANAGGPPAGGFAEASDDALELGHRLTFLASVRLVRGVLPRMRERRWGRILAITSISVFEPLANLALSNAYRPALTGLLKTLASEVACEGVTVNSVCPGYTDTGRLRDLARSSAVRGGGAPEALLESWSKAAPAGRLGRPEEVAAAVAFLCSEGAAYITGVSLPVDGGRLRGLLA
jgi:3-oxoacyl-[acyl-carrier protein] reductase